MTLYDSIHSISTINHSKWSTNYTQNRVKIGTPRPQFNPLPSIPENDASTLYRAFYPYVSYIFNQSHGLSDDLDRIANGIQSMTHSIVEDLQAFKHSRHALYEFYKTSTDPEDKLKLDILHLIDVIKSGGDIDSPYGKPAGQPSDK